MIETPFGNIYGIDDETVTLFELRELFKEIEKGTIKNISYGEYNHRTHSIDHKSFEISKITRCKDCKHFKCGKCWKVMRRYGLNDDFFCGDAEPKGGDSQ